MREQPDAPAQTFFETMEQVPSQVYYGLSMASIIASATLYLTGRRNVALFVGQWAPTFLALPVFYKLLRPSREEPVRGIREAAEEVRRAA